MAPVCSQCGGEVPPLPPAPIRWFFDGMLMCSMECVHAAGDRSNCGAWCECTGYAIKRGLLREHRVQMRVMDNVIRDHDLEEEAEDLLVEETGNTGFYLGWDSEMDEASDEEDPEQELRAAAADQSAMVQAVQGAFECRKVLKDMERACMQLENLKSGVLLR